MADTIPLSGVDKLARDAACRAPSLRSAILRTTAMYGGTTVSRIVGDARDKNSSVARRVAAKLMLEHIDEDEKVVGKLLGGRAGNAIRYMCSCGVDGDLSRRVESALEHRND